MSLQRRGVLTHIRRLFSPSEQLEAEDLQERARDCGASPLSECCDRTKVRIRGTVSSVTKLESGGVEALLTDGTGSIELNWTGRRRLDCITPGCSVVVHGRIASGDHGRVMYNPEFDIVG